MGRYGIIVSQEGIPVDRAADYQRVLDDQWPYIDIVFDREIILDKKQWGPGSGWWVQELFTHDLGYIPAFMWREIEGTAVDFFGEEIPFVEGNRHIIATKNKIYAMGLYVDGDPTVPLYVRGQIRILNVDITKEFRFNFEKAAPRARVSGKRYGVNALNPQAKNPKIDDKDMRSFSVNSNAKALAVQQTGLRTAASPDFTLSIEHNVGYPPTYFVAEYLGPSDMVGAYPVPIELTDKNWCYPLNSDIIGRSRATTTTLTISGAQAALTGTWAFLIAKDPIEVAA